MILKKYGTTMQSVDMNFRASAMTEVGFRRDRETSIPVEQFESEWTQVEEKTFSPRSEGDVQTEVEQAMLDELTSEVRTFEEALGEGEVLVVESESGVDYPKVRHESRGVIIEGENKLVFTGRIEPGLRIARYRKG